MDFALAAAFGSATDALASLAIGAGVCFFIFLVVMAALKDR